MRAVEAGDFPPSLSVTSQLNRLRQRTPSTLSSDHLFVGLQRGRLQSSPTLLSINLLPLILQMYLDPFIQLDQC